MACAEVRGTHDGRVGASRPAEVDERTEHVFICLVVTGAENKLCVSVVVKDTFHNLALVDSERADFKILLAEQNLDGEIVGCGEILKMRLAFFRLEGTVVGVAVAVVPSD